MNRSVEKTIQTFEKIQNKLSKLTGKIQRWGFDTSQLTSAVTAIGAGTEKFKTDAKDYTPKRGPRPTAKVAYIPEPGDKVTFEGAEYTVKKVDKGIAIIEDSNGIISVAKVTKVSRVA